jgi:5'-nucleotidase
LSSSHSYTEKRVWVELHLGLNAAHRLTLSPHKHLNLGDYLIDHQLNGRGQEEFSGELLHTGSEQFPDCFSIINYIEIRTSGLDTAILK